ncbi:MAG: phosphomannose isomerase type II C-terminal cupin domain [Candidatus Melainabacteria bacterium]
MTTAAATLLFETDALSLHHHRMPAAGELTVEKGPLVHILVISGALKNETDRIHPGAVLTCPAGETTVLSNPGQEPATFLTLQWRGQPQSALPEQSPTEVRPWGSFTVISDDPGYKVKTLTVSPAGRLSLQRHQKREEHWFVLAGAATVTVNEKTETFSPGSYIHIPLHAWHRLANESATPVVILEVQLGSYFGEDDIERSADDYGRH